MYWFDIDKHHHPHFHARYGEFAAVFDLSGGLIEGSLGRTGNGLVKKWAKLRQNEVRLAWRRALSGQEVPWIKPIQ